MKLTADDNDVHDFLSAHWRVADERPLKPERPTAGLADAVKQSNLRWWKARENGDGNCLLLAVAPYSQYDLVLLDLLDERLASAGTSLPVYVANLQDYESLEQFSADFPGLGLG